MALSKSSRFFSGVPPRTDSRQRSPGAWIEHRCPSPPCADARLRDSESDRARRPADRSRRCVSLPRTARSPAPSRRRTHSTWPSATCASITSCEENSAARPARARVQDASGQRRLHIADRLLPQVADLTRALVPVLGLVDAVERGVRFGEPVHADRADGRCPPRRRRESLRRASTSAGASGRAAPAQIRSPCRSTPRTSPGRRSRSSVAKLGSQLGQAPPVRSGHPARQRDPTTVVRAIASKLEPAWISESSDSRRVRRS